MSRTAVERLARALVAPIAAFDCIASVETDSRPWASVTFTGEQHRLAIRLSGTGAGNLAVALTDGKMIATAPAGAGANSRDPGNLDALRQAISTDDPSGAVDGLLFDISSNVAGRTITRDALKSIAGSASVALQAQAGVDLDNEAVNLVRFQQAFQANGRVMQVASDIFDTLLAIK